MKVTVLSMFLLTLVLTIVAYMKDSSLPLEGLKAGGNLLWDILPALILAFIAAGMISIALPREFLTRFLGDESGFRGLFIATIAGSLTPGGPFIQFPIVASLLKAGAGVAPLMAYISAWSLFGISRFLIFELPILGWKLSICRIIASLAFPIIIGILTRILWMRL
jgi:uncharacterized membrane protein YraQ (UPF0718 family)